MTRIREEEEEEMHHKQTYRQQISYPPNTMEEIINKRYIESG